MKLLFLMFAFLCLQTTAPVQAGKKAQAPAPKKEVKKRFMLAPSILIVRY